MAFSEVLCCLSEGERVTRKALAHYASSMGRDFRVGGVASTLGCTAWTRWKTPRPWRGVCQAKSGRAKAHCQASLQDSPQELQELQEPQGPHEPHEPHLQVR
mmetsp:Transcript_22778/g.42622  ORF Transcript_22778/g.42622 Transcript_22778/m.42622 type:complete len:102 (-) Transcript_22778:82-387(-)